MNIWKAILAKFRNSRSLIFFKIVALKISQISQETTVFEFVFNKAVALLKRDSNKVLSCEIFKIFKNIFFTEYFRWLFLNTNNHWKNVKRRLKISTLNGTKSELNQQKDWNKLNPFMTEAIII